MVQLQAVSQIFTENFLARYKSRIYVYRIFLFCTFYLYPRSLFPPQLISTLSLNKQLQVFSGVW